MSKCPLKAKLQTPLPTITSAYSLYVPIFLEGGGILSDKDMIKPRGSAWGSAEVGLRMETTAVRNKAQEETTDSHLQADLTGLLPLLTKE